VKVAPPYIEVLISRVGVQLVEGLYCVGFASSRPAIVCLVIMVILTEHQGRTGQQSAALICAHQADPTCLEVIRLVYDGGLICVTPIAGVQKEIDIQVGRHLKGAIVIATPGSA
jgi:hypothetical protein